MKHKINKLELQIGLESGEGAPGTFPQAAPAARADSKAEGVYGREKTPELRLVHRGCC